MTVEQGRQRVGTDPRGTAVLRSGVRWSQAAVLLVVVASVVVRLLPLDARWADVVVPVVAGLGLLLGLPHGSVDHVVAARTTGWSLPVVVAAYAGVAAAAWVLLSTAGVVGLVLVLGLSAVHFGLGELEVVGETTGWRPATGISAAVAVSGTGALLLPLARGGRDVLDVAATLSPELADVLGATPTRVVLLGLWLLAAIVAVVAGWRAGQRQVVADVLLVGSLGSLAPALVAFAVWFGAWDSLRHCARLLLADDRCAAWVEAGRPGRAVHELVRRSAWPTLAALGFVAVLLVLSATAADPASAIGTAVLVLLALTVPHVVVVLWLDRESRPTAGASGPRRTG